MSSMPCIHFGRINQPHRTVFCCFIGHKSGFIDTYTLFSCIHQYRRIWKTLQQTQAMTRAHITRSMYGKNERWQPRLGKRMCTLIERADESMRQCKHTMVAIILLKLGLADWRNDATFRPSLNFGFAHVLWPCRGFWKQVIELCSQVVFLRRQSIVLAHTTLPSPSAQQTNAYIDLRRFFMIFDSFASSTNRLFLVIWWRSDIKKKTWFWIYSFSFFVHNLSIFYGCMNLMSRFKCISSSKSYERKFLSTFNANWS